MMATKASVTADKAIVRVVCESFTVASFFVIVFMNDGFKRNCNSKVYYPLITSNTPVVNFIAKK